jgi:Thioredoxin like C-terminal domain
MVIRQLLAAAGVDDLPSGLSTVDASGDEAQADWDDLGSPETYLGYDQATGFEAAGAAPRDRPHVYAAPLRMRLNHWGLSGNWTVRSDASALNEPKGRIAFQFHAREVNLVMGPGRKGATVPFRVLIDGQSASEAHGVDVDADGNGTVVQQHMYQLIRQRLPVGERRFEIEFLEAGAEAFRFTFG